MARRMLPVVVVGICISFSIAFVLDHGKSVSTDSDEAYEAYLEGIHNYNKFYFAEAHKSFTDAVEKDPEFAMAYLRLHKLAKAAGVPEESVAYLEKAFACRRHVREKERLLIEFEYARVKSRTQQADSLLALLVERYPADVDVLWLQALRRAADGNRKGAIRLCEKLIELDPARATAYNVLGYWYAFDGDYRKAMNSLQKYAFIVPDQANPHDSLGELYLWLGRYADAEREFNKALEIKKDFYWSAVKLARVYHATGRDSLAIDLLSRVRYYAKNKSMKMDATTTLSFVYREMGKPHKALDAIWSFADSYPSEKWLLVELGASYAESGLLDAARAAAESLRVVEAREALLRGLKADAVEHRPGYQYLLGLINKNEGKPGKALEAFKRALEAESSPLLKTTIRREIAGIYVEEGEIDKAEQVLTEALETNPNEARCLALLADLFHRQGNEAKARQLASKCLGVLRQADTQTEAARQAGMIVRKTG